MSAGWASAIPVILVAVGALLVPGLIATAPVRMAPVARIALSGVIGVASIGFAGVLFALLRIPFSPWQILVPAVVIGLVAWTVRRRLPAVTSGRLGARWWALLATWIASAALIAVVAFWDVPSPGLFSQTYDNVFHLAAIAHIVMDGDASSLTLRTLMEPERAWSFYPSAWHTLVAATAQLTGAGIPVSVNASWVATCAAVWLPGVAWLAQVLARGFAPVRVALVALPLGAAFGAMPYALLSWGTLYPTFLATAILPVAVALPVAAWQRFRSEDARTPLLVAAGAIALVLAAVVFSQPRVAVTWALLLSPFVIIEAWRSFRGAWRAGGRQRRRAVTVLGVAGGVLFLSAMAGFAYVVLRLGLFERPLDDRLGGPQARATQTVAEGFGQVLAQAWPTGSSGVVAFSAVLLAVFVVIGIVAVWRTGDYRWAVVSYALSALLFALAAGSDDVVTKLLTALWYKDRYRLSSAIPVLGVAFATIGILSAGRFLSGRAKLRMAVDRLAPHVIAWVTALTATASLVLSGASSSIGEVFAMPDESASDEVVSQRQLEFLRDVGTIVPRDQLLLGDPWDGSALSLLFGGIRPVFPHVTGQWGENRIALAHRLHDIEVDPQICAALDALGVRYIVYNSHEFGGGDPIGNQFFAIHQAVEAGLFSPVLTDGESTLYRIDQCGALPGE